MAWNEPGGNNQDPWGGKRGNDGPPDLDEALKKFQEKLGGLFGGAGSGGGSQGGGLSSSALGIIVVGLLVVYALFGIYQVNEQERAVILRLGVYSQTKGPGLHWNPPLIDTVEKLNVTKVRSHSSRGEMLTEDLNIVKVDLSVQYRINDARAFALMVRAPEESLAQATDSALRHVVGSSPMHEVLTEGREKIAFDVQARLQAYLDAYTTGIEISTVNVEDTAPPNEVQAAFDDVNKAREDEERLKNEAEAYANGIIPEARGKAQRVIEEATAYREQVIAKAEGEAKRFEQLLFEYNKAPAVTRERLYLDAVQEVMANSSKVMIDVEGGNNMLYVPLDKLVNASAVSARTQELSPEIVREISERVADQIRRENITNTRRREVR
ncbi:MAG: FtsH protease activity modulator HflK [Gammaproteobacteria bacterium]|uniref:FtsH protease activity modulator HflK n=1 Tax=Pseudomaricurvus alcaniphilus TaxID=1166482 RepID=UPI00140D15C6|nr:FtsH protease activity modulator HflK [Pseudomaricurvus alcaniphilus]MBR9909806.1 FtsH protease activity modulator HflK [Gammaproteobacteria bacterium]NHN38532.1 FtsH protease activity modulator HflK [Pseudomaricurvus alcaniphilus]